MMKFIIIIFLLVFCSCASKYTRDKKNDIFTESWQQEPMFFTSRNNCPHYLQNFKKSAKFDSLATIKFLEYSFINGWDAAAAETHSENLMYILDEYGDRKFSEIIKKCIFNQNQKQILLNYLKIAQYLKNGQCPFDTLLTLEKKYPQTIYELKPKSGMISDGMPRN